jgi:hypothetical protein
VTKSSAEKLAYQKAFNARPEEVAKRVKNNAARAGAIKAGKVSVGDGKDIGHIKPLDKGGTNDTSNLAVQSTEKNRGWRKGKSGSDSYNPTPRK